MIEPSLGEWNLKIEMGKSPSNGCSLVLVVLMQHGYDGCSDKDGYPNKTSG